MRTLFWFMVTLFALLGYEAITESGWDPAKQDAATATICLVVAVLTLAALAIGRNRP